MKSPVTDFYLYPRLRQSLKRRPFTDADAAQTAVKTLLKALKETRLLYYSTQNFTIVERSASLYGIITAKEKPKDTNQPLLISK